MPVKEERNEGGLGAELVLGVKLVPDVLLLICQLRTFISTLSSMLTDGHTFINYGS